MRSKYARSEGGLTIPVVAKVRGQLRWSVLDERGVPEVPRTPSGLPIAPAEGVCQSNLITDLGMDAIVQFGFANDGSPATAASWRRYLAVGTGSAAPSVEDVTLDSEVQRANTSGAFPGAARSFALDDDRDVWTADYMVTRLVTMSADRNLTEFGFSSESSANIYIRELLRDSEGDPVTVSLLSGKTLRVDHHLLAELPAPEAGISDTINIEEYDAGNNLVNTIPMGITHGGRASSLVSGDIEHIFDVLFGGVISGFRRQYQAASYSRTLSATHYAIGNNNEQGQDAYVPGSHQIRRYRICAAGSDNGDWYGFCVHGGSSSETGGSWAVVFDSTYEKRSTDTLEFAVICSWERAGS